MQQQHIMTNICQPTAGFASTCSQIEVIDHQSSLGEMCGQNVESSSCCWFSRLELSLKIRRYPFPLDVRLTSFQYTSRKFLPHRVSNQRRVKIFCSRWMSSREKWRCEFSNMALVILQCSWVAKYVKLTECLM